MWPQVSRCAGRPWQRQQRRQHQHQHQRQRPPGPAAAYGPTTAVAVPSYAEYDDPAVAANEPPPPSPLPDQSLPANRPAYSGPEPDYGDSDRLYVEPERVYAEPEQNYEVDEAVSVLSDGRAHGVQQHLQVPATTAPTWSSSLAAVTAINETAVPAAASVSDDAASTTSTGTPETRKSGYVVDGKHYRKYRVEEETPDGFIVGEYGVVSHHDGNTRGVRYTADSSINPRVIYEALAKFLALKRRR